MKSACGPDLYDIAAWNATQMDEVTSFDFEEMLREDKDMDIVT
jgi:hypothetical protein